MNRKKLRKAPLIAAAVTAAILIVALPLFALATGSLGMSGTSSGAQPIARQVQELFSSGNSKVEQSPTLESALTAVGGGGSLLRGFPLMEVR